MDPNAGLARQETQKTALILKPFKQIAKTRQGSRQESKSSESQGSTDQGSTQHDGGYNKGHKQTEGSNTQEEMRLEWRHLRRNIQLN